MRLVLLLPSLLPALVQAGTTCRRKSTTTKTVTSVPTYHHTAPGYQPAPATSEGCLAVSPQCSPAVSSRCSSLATVTITPSLVVSTSTVYANTTVTTLSSTDSLSTSTVTSTTSETISTIVTTDTITSLTTRITTIPVVTETDRVTTTTTSGIVFSPVRRGLDGNYGYPPSYQSICTLASYSSAYSCLGITASTVTLAASSSTTIITSLVDKTATQETETIKTIVSTDRILSTSSTTETIDVTITHTASSTAIPIPPTTTTTSVIATATVHAPQPTFALVLTDNTTPTNDGQFALLEYPSFEPPAPPGTQINFVGFQTSTVGVAMFTLDPSTGRLTSVTSGSQGLFGTYDDGGHSFVIITNASGQNLADTPYVLDCSIDPITFAFTCEYDTGSGFFYTCDGYLGIYFNTVGDAGCAEGAGDSVTLRAIQVA